jgi:5'(3')-deoxyribonucleotidase
MKRTQIFLDQDGVISDFLSSAIKELNKAYDRNVTLEQYAKEFGQWGTYDYYGITVAEFWAPINDKLNFWMDLEPMPWAKKLFLALSAIGDVTVVTAPSQDPDCARQKLQWLNLHLGIKPEQVFLGHRKYLMAGNGILIDDYHKNVDTFREAGGQAILIPSTWNKYDVTFEEIWDIITKAL